MESILIKQAHTHIPTTPHHRASAKLRKSVEPPLTEYVSARYTKYEEKIRLRKPMYSVVISSWNKYPQFHHIIHTWIFMAMCCHGNKDLFLLISLNCDFHLRDKHSLGHVIQSFFFLHVFLLDAMLLHLRQTYNGTKACSGLQQLHSRA